MRTSEIKRKTAETDITLSLVIDGSGRVQNENGETIPGLYAAGEVALTGQLANVYPSCGLAIGNSVHMGRNAAEAACAD